MAQAVTTKDGQWWDGGRVRNMPILVLFVEDEIRLWKARGFTIVGPCPMGMAKLAEWERENR